MKATALPRILVCNVGWMADYRGVKGQSDPITGGGRWVKENNHGHESCNFLASPSGDVFGHFETIKGKVDREVNIGRLDADADADRLDHVDVVWVATDPNGGGRRVIGYYRDATVYRRRQLHASKPTPQHGRDKIGSYMVMARAKNAHCLPMEERTIALGRPPGWIGQANWWFPEKSEHPDVPDFIAKVRTLLAAHSLFGESRKNAGKRSRRSSDPDRNALVEEAAIAEVKKHFSSYFVHSVEKDNRGWDLEVYPQGSLSPQGEPLRKIEVKGLSGASMVVGVTPNEYRSLKKHLRGTLPSYRIAVVTSALSSPRLQIFAYDQARGAWMEEIRNAPVDLDVKKKTAAIVSLI